MDITAGISDIFRLFSIAMKRGSSPHSTAVFFRDSIFYLGYSLWAGEIFSDVVENLGERCVYFFHRADNIIPGI